MNNKAERTDLSIFICLVFLLGLLFSNSPKKCSSSYVYGAESDNYKLGREETDFISEQLYKNYEMDNSDKVKLPDPDKSLAAQFYDSGIQLTWQEYRVQYILKPYLERMLVLLEAAKNEGYELDSKEEKSCEEAADNYPESQRDTALEVLKMQTLAQSYSEHLYSAFEYTDEQIENFRQENILNYMNCSLYKADLYFTDSETESLAKKYAELAAASKDLRAIKEWAAEYYSETEDIDYEEAKEKAEGFEYKLYECRADDEVSKWALENSDGSAGFVKQGNCYSVCYLLKAPYDDKRTAVNIRLIVFKEREYPDPYAKAEEVLSEWKRGEMTEESFAALAGKYSSESSGTSGGLYLNVAGSGIEEMTEWLSDKGRKQGDTAVFEQDNGTSYLAYYVSEAGQVADIDLENDMRESDYNDVYNRFCTVYTVNYDEERKNTYYLSVF